MLTSTHELLISTAALDVECRFDELLRVIPFDLEGRLVKRVSLSGQSKSLNGSATLTLTACRSFRRLGTSMGGGDEEVAGQLYRLWGVYVCFHARDQMPSVNLTLE